MLGITVSLFFLGVVALSFVVMPKKASLDGFYDGRFRGVQPGLWTLVLSQVTTWIFARSLMNSAILGYFYGFPGTLAYAAYYLSFLTGGYIIGQLRERRTGSVQDWLGAHFGVVGQGTYNFVIALRLLSEVFANLIVVGLIFSALLPETMGAGTAAIVIVAALGLVYSAWGGLSAALRTDVLQMAVFLFVFGIAFLYLFLAPGFSLSAIVTAEGTSGTVSYTHLTLPTTPYV